MIGICKKAGHAICGTEMVCEALRKGSGAVFLSLVACDASENTKKKLSDKCRFYGVKLIATPLTGSELGDAVGKSGTVAAVAITDAGLSAAVEKKVNL